jgi:hypothetical protein
MTVEVGIATYLLGVAEIAALVGTRVYQLFLPQAATLPAVRVQLIDDPETYTHDGPSGLRKARIQVDAIAGRSSGSDPYDDASALADTVDTALSGYVGWAGNPGVSILSCLRDSRVPIPEAPDEVGQLKIAQDYVVWYRA